ncbi:MAG TPA: RagB/SusD family nutrient uptake outer membrane protein [Prevotella sp.]|nr:RagB/SusD family nutrient uptake outer membrane protein [Candidatus Segatella violae]
MKLNINISRVLMVLCIGGAMVSCSDLLDQEPPSYVVPSDYFKTADQVQACANSFYSSILPSHGGGYGLYANDCGTDNQAAMGADGKYADNQWKTSLDNGNWSWGNVRSLNYKIKTCVTNNEKGLISGNQKDIKQYIGEMYFFRAYTYFGLLRNWGDFPIVTEVLPDNETELVAANKRRPRNEVARFIISDLDTAMTYMADNFESRHTRVSKDVAMLFKSRVALYEASFLTYFKDTPFVPNGPGWPGKDKDYNANYQYPTGSIDKEIEYFLKTAAEAAEYIADKYKADLTQNTGVIPQSSSDPDNPYFSMFGTTDMSGYKEVLLWRQYSNSLGVTNDVEDAIQRGNRGAGVTRSMVESFLMSDGKPIYAEHDGYAYDDNNINKVAANRDPRLQIFLKQPGQINCYLNMDYASGDRLVEVEGNKPDITNGSDDWKYTTGYCLRKGGTFDRQQCRNYRCENAACCFRAREALLNYMEAEYMLTKNLNAGKILEYWKIIREKAGFKGAAIDPNTTIAATDMSKEKLDWGAYSGGRLLDDPVLYNIRRERRDELMGEALRWMDVQRWRSLDQLMTEHYHVEGFKLWNSDMTALYKFGENAYNGLADAMVSAPTLSNYLRPYEKNTTSGNLFKDGYTWHMAHYLQPMPIKQMMLTAPDHATVSESPLYQNPYWPTEVAEPAEK